MKKSILFVLLCACSILAAFVPIYDIQYTTIPGEEGGYPSALEGTVVETGGIVTGVNFSNGRYYISSEEGGAWNGLYIYDNEHSPQIGDSLLLTGEVFEYYGFTELSNISSYEVVSSNNALPEPAQISCEEVNEEAFESVYVELSNIESSESYNEYAQWKVSDDSGECKIGVGFYSLEESGFAMPIGYPIASMRGLISFSWGEFLFHPRNLEDFYAENDAYVLSFDSQDLYNVSTLNLPINLSILSQESNIESLQFALSYNSSLIEYNSYGMTTSFLNNSGVTIEETPGNFTLNYTGTSTLELMQNLVTLNFDLIGDGNANLEFTSAVVNNQNLNNFLAGDIHIDLEATEVGDTLTVIQRPIMNIPEIITPEETFEIWCIAPENTTNWQAELVYGNLNFALDIISTEYNDQFEHWTLIASGNPDYYELYDLRVFADGEIDDTSENAVRFIPEEKANFNFVHISDTHLPTHIFWSDDPEQALMDTTGIEDLREVIQDINLINPEFVVLTGDVVNEGELEDFGNGRCYTKAQRILSEFTVPVYVVSGNHDLGGWDSTPPSQGTSRRDWWRFFGWKWLAEVPEGSSQRTQDYSFEYGNNKFIGLESYINYDSYMDEIFGSDSFIPTQMQWLNLELQNSADFENRILFYHFDFSEQIFLESMNIDMALYGHIHSNEGSIHNAPYNLAVDSVCDETQAYRIIKITDGEISPQETTYANWPENNMNLTFSEETTDSNLIITATITNNHDMDFTDCAFRYPYMGDAHNFSASEGEIQHNLHFDGRSELLLLFDIEANSEKQITLTAPLTAEDVTPADRSFKSYPNPFVLNPKGRNTYHTFSFSGIKNVKRAQIEIFNVKGQKVQSLEFDKNKNEIKTVHWNGKDSNGKLVPTGVYFSRFILNGEAVETKKMLIMK